MDQYLCFWLIVLAPGIVFSGHLYTPPGKKSWAYDVNYGNPNNWEGGVMPCANSRAILPSFTSVFLQVNTSVREMVFADDGELILGSNVNLQLGEQPKSSSSNDCPENDVLFKDPKFTSWYSPNAWRAEGIEKDDIIIPIPEIERIPCYYDEVHFGQDSSFAVSIDGPSISIRSMTFAGQYLNTSEFEELIATTSGQHQFHKQRLSTVTMHEKYCSEITGCLCGNSKQSIIAVVCKLTTCPELDCTDPVKAIGSCCYTCGSIVVVKYNRDFDFLKISKIYNKFLNKPGYENVYGYLSKTEEGTNQAIFLDKSESHKAAALAHEIETTINEDIKNLGTLGITSVTIQVSQNWIQHSFGQKRGLSVGGVMGIVFAFILFVAVGLAGLGYYRKHKWVDLSFGRLYEDPKPEETVTFSAGSASLTGFANPMYQEPRKGPLYEDTAIGPQAKTSTEERTNPVFMGLDDDDAETTN